MKLRGNKGEGTVAIVLVVVLVGALFGGPSLKSFWKSRKEKQLAKVEQRIQETDTKKDGEDKKQLEQAAQYVHATGVAITEIPGESTAKDLASELNGKAADALDEGRNDRLTPAQKKEMEEIVARALSPLLAENKQAREQLQLKDRALNESVAREEKLAQKAKELKTRAEDLEKGINTLSEENSLLNRILYYAKVAGILYLFFAYGLPVLATFVPGLLPVAKFFKGALAIGVAQTQNAFTAVVKGVQSARENLKKGVDLTDAKDASHAEYAKKKLKEMQAQVDAALRDEIYDNNAKAVDDERRAQKLI